MKTYIIVLLIVAVSASPAAAIAGFSLGPYGGMSHPVFNDEIEGGPVFGAQAKVSLASFFAVGVHLQARNAGNPEQTFFAGTPAEMTLEKDGGEISSFGGDLYLGGRAGTAGVNFYLVGSIATYKWTRANQDDVSKTSFSAGPGLEIVLPFGLGIEGRIMGEVVPTGSEGSWKNALWFVGLNYHVGLRSLREEGTR